MVTRLARWLGLALLLLPGWAGAQAPPGVTVSAAGAPVVVMRHATDACEPIDYADAPARAFRGADGRVTLLAPHWRNRRLRGPDLLAVRPECPVLLDSHDDPRPQMHDDKLWLAGTWTADGVTIHALVHGEYQGHRHPGQCATGRYMECWTNVITQVVSRDGGARFERLGAPPPVVSAVPYRHDPAQGRHVGFFGPSNIQRWDNAWYAMVFTEGAGLQRRGTCLLRSPDIADPTAWRAWDGTGFRVRLGDPYADPPPVPAEHVCAPIGGGGLPQPVTSLVRHAPSGTWIALMIGRRPGDAPRLVVLASASRDLVAWSPPRPVLDGPPVGAMGCDGAERPLVYPSLLDPASPDRNFSTVGATAQLYATRFNPVPRDAGCGIGNDRDLIRIPVTIAVDGP